MHEQKLVSIGTSRAVILPKNELLQTGKFDKVVIDHQRTPDGKYQWVITPIMKVKK
jgi:hypothetical protein